MPKENGPKKGSRWIRVDGAVRLIDTPNSRMGLEVDLGLLPWDPFDALGKRVTVLVPSSESGEDTTELGGDDLQQALRFVGHAADRCREFAEAGNGDTSDWWRAFRTWNWLREHLTQEWEADIAREEEDPEDLSPEDPNAEDVLRERLPSLPGAASILEFTLGALRTISLQHWEETVATLDPEAPSRAEAIKTIQILSSLLRKPALEEEPAESDSPDESPADGSPSAGAGPAPPSDSDSARETEVDGADTSAEGSSPTGPSRSSEEEDDMSFDYAHGFDEGYTMGRRVGFALGNHARRRGRILPDKG